MAVALTAHADTGLAGPGKPPGEGPDPPPRPPEPPMPAECCESGCERCVYDIYAEDLDYYRAQLAAWRERNPGREPDVTGG